MIITKSKILKVPKELKKEKEYYVGVKANKENLAKLHVLEFDNGLSLNPSPKYGITCTKNLYGFYTYNKELPKEYRYVNTIPWEFTLRNGRIISGYNDIYKFCIHRDKIEPYNINMVLVTNSKNEEMIVSKVNDFSLIKEMINIYLEVFKYCEILDNKLIPTINKLHYSKKNWEILPPGVKVDINKFINKNNNFSNKKGAYFIKERLEKLEKTKPLEVYKGFNELDGYLAYVYQNICILECPIYGNATYIIKSEDWENTSKLDKTNILKSDNFIKKIDHNMLWFEMLKDVFKNQGQSI